jgi:hypothetical protein
MHIKKFTQFILENEYYGDINEGDIVPGVPYNSGTDRSDKLGNMEASIMTVDTNDNDTIIGFNKGGESPKSVSIYFPSSSYAGTKMPLGLKQGKSYAYIYERVDGDDRYPAAITKMEDFDADKSSGQLYNASNSIDLLANFMEKSGICVDSTAGANLAKVITTLLLSTTYNTKVTDTFLKFAKKISREITIEGFIPKMAAQFGNSGTKQDPGMKAFVNEFPISRAALSPKKA